VCNDEINSATETILSLSLLAWRVYGRPRVHIVRKSCHIIFIFGCWRWRAHPPRTRSPFPFDYTVGIFTDSVPCAENTANVIYYCKDVLAANREKFSRRRRRHRRHAAADDRRLDRRATSYWHLLLFARNTRLITGSGLEVMYYQKKKRYENKINSSFRIIWTSYYYINVLNDAYYLKFKSDCSSYGRTRLLIVFNHLKFLFFGIFFLLFIRNASRDAGINRRHRKAVGKLRW